MDNTNGKLGSGAQNLRFWKELDSQIYANLCAESVLVPAESDQEVRKFLMNWAGYCQSRRRQKGRMRQISLDTSAGFVGRTLSLFQAKKGLTLSFTTCETSTCPQQTDANSVNHQEKVKTHLKGSNSTKKEREKKIGRNNN